MSFNYDAGDLFEHEEESYRQPNTTFMLGSNGVPSLLYSKQLLMKNKHQINYDFDAVSFANCIVKSRK